MTYTDKQITEVKRYDFDCVSYGDDDTFMMNEEVDGDYVKYSDHEKLLSKMETMEKKQETTFIQNGELIKEADDMYLRLKKAEDRMKTMDGYMRHKHMCEKIQGYFYDDCTCGLEALNKDGEYNE